jgi:plastocyanin
MNQITIASIILAGGLVVSALVATNGLQGNSGVKTFNIVMENNQYRPAEITANVGDQVVINFENRDAVSHAVALPEFNAAVPNGHVPAGGRATMQFVASRAVSTDAAVCGGANPTDKTDDHGEELIVTII